MRTLINTEGHTFHGLGSTSFIKREPHCPFIRSFVSRRKNSISKRYNCISGQNVTEKIWSISRKRTSNRTRELVALWPMVWSFLSLWCFDLTCSLCFQHASKNVPLFICTEYQNSKNRKPDLKYTAQLRMSRFFVLLLVAELSLRK